MKCSVRWLHPRYLLLLGLTPRRDCFLFIPNSLRPGPGRGRITAAITGRVGRRKTVLTGYPGHELQGPQDTHGPQGPQVHVCVEVGSCSGQDPADGDTEGQSHQGRAFSPCPMGEAGLKKHPPGKHAELMLVACGHT